MTDTMIEYNTKEAAEAASVPYGTLKSWLADGVQIPYRTDTRGGRRYGLEGIDAIRRVAKLRNQDGRNLASIRAILGPIFSPAESRPEPVVGPATAQMAPDRAEAEGRPDPGPTAAGPNPVANSSPAGTTVIIEDIVAAATIQLEGRMVEVLREQTELAEKYARAAHTIGRLEAELSAARADAMRLSEGSTKAETELSRVGAELREALAAAARATELEMMLSHAQVDASERRRAFGERERLASELDRSAVERTRIEVELGRALEALGHARLALEPTGSNGHPGPGRASARPWWKIWG